VEAEEGISPQRHEDHTKTHEENRNAGLKAEGIEETKEKGKKELGRPIWLLLVFLLCFLMSWF
jgi:hypothetical protein